MSALLSDADIADIRTAAEVGVADTGHGAEPTQEQILAMAREIQDSRPIVEAAARWLVAKCAGSPECSAYEEDHGDACPITITTLALCRALDGRVS